MIDFDRILERIGQWKRYQLYHYILLGLAALPIGMHNLANVFVALSPDHWCDVPDLANLSVTAARRLSAPLEDYNGQGLVPSSCLVYDMDYEHLDLRQALNSTSLDLNVSGTRQCDSWQYDRSEFPNTIVSRWDLVCSERWKKAMASSVYMAGFLIGAVGFGSLSDKIGRKPSWFASLILLVASGCIGCGLPSYWPHVMVRLVSGIAAGGNFTIGFVIVMEIVGMDFRMTSGIFFQGFFAAGYMLLAVLAYFIRDYRWLLLTISVFPSVFLPYWWLIGESPRWLLIQRKQRKAETEIQRACKMNQCPYPADLVQQELSELKALRNAQHESNDRNYTIIDLLRTPNMRKKSLNVFFNWYVVSLVYYGLSLGVSDLVGTPQVALFISGLMEFPGYLCATLTLDRVGRRWPYALLMILGGVSCSIIPFLPSDMRITQTVLAMLGKLFISGAFAIIYVFSAELFPTVVRTMGVGAGSMNARVGGLMAPFIAELGFLSGIMALPMLIFGAASIAGGIASLWLPETLHQHLPETLQDGELFGKQGTKLLSWARKTNGKVPEVEGNGQGIAV